MVYLALSDLPVDLIVHDLLPCLDAQSLVALGSTSKAFHALILQSGTGTSEILWRYRLSRDLNFPVSNTARSTGWLKLYQKATHPELYVWGCTQNGRSGIQNPPYQGLLQPTRLRLPKGVKIVDIVAGGWSFHFLDATGKIWFQGQMSGDAAWEFEGPYTDSGRVQRTPRRLPLDLLAPVVALDCGRSHVLALDKNNQVYEFRSWGRIAHLHDSQSRWGHILSISCGWSFSALLTRKEKRNTVFIHHAPSQNNIISAASSQGFGSEGHEVEGTLFPLDVPSLQLPQLPEPYEKETITQIASGDEFLICLSDEARVFKIDVSAPPHPAHLPPPPTERDPNRVEGMDVRSRERLQLAFESGERAWVYMPFFCDSDRIAGLQGFQVKPRARISHVSAHFEHFVVVSIGEEKEQQVVLMGRRETGPDDEPNVVPGLQGRGVIKMVMGDYHFGALTDSGSLLTWGQHSSGALGHGSGNMNLLPFAERQVANGNVRPPPGTAPRWAMQAPRTSLAEPAVVNFMPQLDIDYTKKFVFNAAFSGWHSAALTVDLDDEEEEQGEEDLDDGSEAPTPAPAPEEAQPSRTMFRIPPIRRGFALGRGNRITRQD